MLKYYNVTHHILLVIISVCIVGLLALCGCKARGMSEKKASETFRKYVLNPIPKSVTNIKADQPKWIRGYRYTFRFGINRDDLALIINSGPFVKVWKVKYKDGNLSWQWNCDGFLGIGPTSEMSCYDHTHEPSWFKLGLWDNPETYAFWKEGDLVNVERFEKDSSGPTEIKVLLYNEKEAEAYFIVTYWEK